jgi:hypothetical protein
MELIIAAKAALSVTLLAPRHRRSSGFSGASGVSGIIATVMIVHL